MRTLKFMVTGQSIEKDPTCNFEGIVQGTTNYLNILFTFSKDWDAFVKVAEFRIGTNNATITPVPIVNNRCDVPSEVTDGRTWSVRIVGKKGKTKLTSKTIRVQQERR